MSQLEIRPAAAADLPAITGIYEQAVLYGTATFELIPPDLAEMTRRFAALIDGGFPYLVAALESRVVGYAYAVPFRKRPAYRYTVKHSIYVRSDRLHAGIGRQLMNALIDACAAAGFRQMIGYIDGANVASIKLHEGFGFRQVGYLPAVGYKFGRWTDSIMMQRSLGPGATEPPTA